MSRLDNIPDHLSRRAARAEAESGESNACAGPMARAECEQHVGATPGPNVEKLHKEWRESVNAFHAANVEYHEIEVIFERARKRHAEARGRLADTRARFIDAVER